MKRNYPLWTSVPYAGETHPPDNPVEPYSGSWTLHYLKHGKKGFTTLDGRPVKLDIEHPNVIDWNNQLRIVQQTMRHITKQEATIAEYWGAGPATKQWTPIADILIDTYGVEAPRAARILSALCSGMNDAFVVSWYLKYKWLVARPNQFDQKLATVICTPYHPTYPSGHATISGAAEVILGYFFPAEREKLHHLAKENAMSRLYGGVHFPADNDEGLRLGRQIGEIVVSELCKEVDETGYPIDVPYDEYRDAAVVPPPYMQAIPYDFDTSCNSLIMNIPAHRTVKNMNVPKPWFSGKHL